MKCLSMISEGAGVWRGCTWEW